MKTFFIITLVMNVVYSEPYMAIRSGLKCVVCHVNGSGGGKRTAFGNEYAHYKLNMGLIRPPEESNFLGGEINEFMSTGANLRLDFTRSMDYKHEGEVIGNGVHGTSAVESNVYFQFNAINDKLIFYSDIELKSSATGREYWGMLRLPFNSFVKYGKMLLPYGYRIYDDLAFIRGQTGYTYNTQGLGLELGIEPGPVSFILNVMDNQFQSVACLVYKHWRVGASFRRMTFGSGTGLLGDDYIYGILSGANFGRFTLMFEADVLNSINKEKSALVPGVDVWQEDLVLLLENNFLIIDGLNFKTTYEFMDPNSKLFGNPFGVDKARNGKEKITVGLEAFLSPFLMCGLFYQIKNGVPDNGPDNQNALNARIYGFF